MNKQTLTIASLTGVLTVIGVVLTVFAWLPGNTEKLTVFVQDHATLAPFIIIAWRILSTIFPPLPGGTLSIAMLPVFGWFLSVVYGSIGLLIGTSIAFFLARHFREPLVRKFIPLQKLHTWEKKLSGETEFFTFLFIRFITQPALDFISYAAGLSKISYWKFLLATIITLIPTSILYFLGDNIYHKNAYFGIGFIVLLVIGIAIAKKKKFFRV